MINYLEINNYFDQYQSAFRYSYSTQSALIRILDDARKSIDSGKVVILVSFDFSKAFDTLNHTLLLYKLREFGFSDEAIKWVYNYLHSRSQSVIDQDGNSSPFLNIALGVPQGSVFGPILFLTYINSNID